jgi:hypothetical protein
MRDESEAGVLGFEPRQTDPESVVLPLHYTPIFSHLSGVARIYKITFRGAGFEFFHFFLAIGLR